ncbi:MAG: hypothetical protein IPH62_11770 [Ignavibacteriae bacterium]|nr:hypothetical protein [Ignavibacteriota bacterium]
MKRETLTMAVFLIALIFSSVVSAQQNESTKVDLLNFDVVKSYLSLDIDQQKTIEPLINDIIDIKDQADKTRNKMRSNMQSMGTPDPSMREKMMKERSARQNKIDGLIKQIEQLLNKKQLEKFNEIDKPNLIKKSGHMKSK